MDARTIAAAAVSISLAALSSSAITGPRAGPVPTQALYDELAAKDAALFHAVFDTCDTDAIAGLVADDLEFFHDKDGLSFTSGKAFVDGIKGMCARQAAGTDYRARRVIVPGTLKVFPLNNYGAIQTGVHQFYGVGGVNDGKLIEEAAFFDVWQKDGATWKLARVFSYDHRLVG